VHRLSTSFVLGYHGCDRSVAERLLAGEPPAPSENTYDWLGHGIYFWEANPARGLSFAYERQARHPEAVPEPRVVGAVIDLGFCLDLMSDMGIAAVRKAYEVLADTTAQSGEPLPKNRKGDDRLLRSLDCLVVNTLHKIREREVQQPFDSVRALFVEGQPIYENAGFHEKTHIQICVRNPASIKGFFRVPADELPH